MRKLFQLIIIPLLSFTTYAQQINLVQDFGTNGLKLDDTTVFNGNLYFSTQEEAGFASTLYSVDSNNNITPLYTSTSSIFNLVQLGNHVYFTATGTSGWAFYRIDSSGTVSLVSETNAPFLDAIAYNNEIYFSGVNGGADLYAYSEITNGFRLVDANFDYGMGVSGLIVHNGELYFRGTIEGTTSNRALFKTNGSTISQVVAFDSQIYQDISNPYTFVSFGNELYFSAPVDASSNYQLFKVNTNSNQLTLASTYYVVNNHIPFVFNNELYFTGRPSINSNSVYELLKQNELGVITSIPLGIENGQIEVGSASFGSISEASDFYLVAFTSSVGFELFNINNDTLELFVDYVPGNTWGVSPNYSNLLSFNNKLYLGGGNLQSSGLSTQLLELPEAECINTITINDNNFEAYLENELGVGDGILANGLVCRELVEQITTLNLSGTENFENFPPGLGITDLSGIEFFTALEVLRVEGNDLTTLNLTSNTNLTELRAWRNNLTTINVQGLSNLSFVGLNFNNITIADFSSNTSLSILDITDNALSSIQLGNQTSLNEFGIANNPSLTSLDISGVDQNLTIFNGAGLTGLSCIQVSNETNANNQANWTKDATTTYSLNCGNQPFTVTTSIGGDVVDTDPEACCTAYEITEGGLLEIYFEADATATLGEDYIVQLSLSGSEATEADISNRENSPTLQYTYSVKAGNPDNTMQIDILNDGIEELGGENLKLTFTAVGSNYSFTGTTVYDITIIDQPTVPYTVAASLTNAGNAPNYTVTEGQTFNLNFNADATAQNGTVYNPIITVTKNGVDATADFTITGLNQPITVANSVNPDGSIQFTANDDGNDTGDEVYTITVASENTAAYTIQTPETFEVTVTEDLEDIYVISTLVGGDVINTGTTSKPIYEVFEGGNIVIEIEAENYPLNATDYGIQVNFSGSAIESQDYEVVTNLPIQFPNLEVEIQTEIDPDGTLLINVLNDEIDELSPDELTISLSATDGNLVFKDSQTSQLEITILLNDLVQTENTVFAKLDNIGGYEGAYDEFTLSLIENGETWKNDTGQEISFPIEIRLETNNGQNQNNIAEDLDFSPNLQRQNGVIIGEIIVPNERSTGVIRIDFETDSDNEHEFYTIEVFQPVSNQNFDFINKELEAKIIDSEGEYEIRATIKSTILTGNYNGSAIFNDDFCCPFWTIEEGEFFEIALEAEKGVFEHAPNKAFFVNVNATGGSDAEPATYGDFEDFYFTDTRSNGTNKDVFEYAARERNPDNTLEVRINSDAEPEFDESFTIQLSVDETANYKLTGDTSRNVIIQNVVSASIEPIDNLINEEDIENDTASFKIVIDTPSPGLNISLELSGNAIEDEDFEAIERTVVFGDDEFEKVITVRGISDNIPEGDETIIVNLVDGRSYSIIENSKSTTLTIPQNDQDKRQFTVFLETIESEAQELNEGQAVLRVSLDEVNTSGIDLPVNFSIVGPETTADLDEDFTINPSSGSVVVVDGANSADIIITAIDDNFLEDRAETVTVQLENGERYFFSSNLQPKATVNIISDEFDTTSLNPSDITVIAQNPTCPGDEQEGKIEILNTSGYLFDITITKVDNSSVQLSAQDVSTNYLSDELAIGIYEVVLKNKTNPDLLSPTYRVEIEELEQMTLKGQKVINGKLNITVSGSVSYNIKNGNEFYTFSFENNKDNVITIPLKKGINQIDINGEKVCFGTIGIEVVNTKLSIVPNPVIDIADVYIPSRTKDLTLNLFDVSGREFKVHYQNISEYQLRLDTSNLPPGVYLIQIMDGKNISEPIKILKK